MKKFMGLFLLVALLLVGCDAVTGNVGGEEEDKVDDTVLIEEFYKDFEAALESDNLATIRSYYSTDFKHEGQGYYDVYDIWDDRGFGVGHIWAVTISGISIDFEGSNASVNSDLVAVADGQTVEDERKSDEGWCYLVKESGRWKIYGNQNPNRPVEHVIFDKDSDFYNFYTNDSDYYDYYFRSAILNESIDPFNTIEVDVVKVSGHSNQPLGIYTQMTDWDNNLVFQITCSGYYSIIQRSSSGSTYYTGEDGDYGWVYAPSIVKCLDYSNTLKIVHDDTANTGKFYINNQLVFTMTGFDISNGEGFQPRLMASIGDSTEESYPNTPVEIEFEILTNN